MTDPLAPQAAAPAAAPVELLPAGFWVRAGATIIDGFVVACLNLLVIFTGGAVLGRFAGVLATLAYGTLTVGAWGQSFGHMVAGCKVVRAADGGPLGYPQAFVRALVGMITSMLLCVGYLIIPFNARKRGPHDFAAGSVVVYPEPVGAPRRYALAALGLSMLLVPFAVGLWLASTATGRGLLSTMTGRGSQLAQLELKSREGATKGNLGSLRAGLAVYYGDHDGAYPEKPEQMFQPTAAAPKPLVDHAGPVTIKDHPSSSDFELYGGEVCGPEGKSLLKDKLRDTGKWGFVADKKSPCWGQLFVDCTHDDSKGVPWYSY